MSPRTLSSYLRPRAQHARWLWLLACTLIAIGTSFGIQAYRLHLIAEQTVARNDKALAARTLVIVPPPSHVEQEEEKRWAALKVERGFPWPAVFLAVERAANVNIELLEFQPDKHSRSIVLQGESRDVKALIGYIDALNKQPALTHVYLVHQEMVVRDRLETVAFEIKAALVE